MKILAIGAHADDIELGLGGTLAKHYANGDNIISLLITHSAYKNYEGEIIRSKETAYREASKAAKILGISTIECLDYETKEVVFDVNLIEKINHIIDKHNIDVVYTHWDGDINQDHSAIAKATIVAARNIPRILMYRSNWYKSHKPFNGTFYVDITDFIDYKIKAIEAHKSETSRRGNKWINFFIQQCRMSGTEVGVEAAEVFQIIKWLN